MILDDVIKNLVIDDSSFILFLIDNNIFTKNELNNYNTIERIINITLNHLHYHLSYLQSEIINNRLNNIDELSFLKYFKKENLLLWNHSLSENNFRFSSNQYDCIISSISLSHLYYYKLSLYNQTSIAEKNKIIDSFKTV
jgi:hypothetical protein